MYTTKEKINLNIAALETKGTLQYATHKAISERFNDICAPYGADVDALRNATIEMSFVERVDVAMCESVARFEMKRKYEKKPCDIFNWYHVDSIKNDIIQAVLVEYYSMPKWARDVLRVSHCRYYIDNIDVANATTKALEKYLEYAEYLATFGDDIVINGMACNGIIDALRIRLFSVARAEFNKMGEHETLLKLKGKYVKRKGEYVRKVTWLEWNDESAKLIENMASIESLANNSNAYIDIMNAIATHGNATDKIVLDMVVLGYTYNEIAKHINSTEKAVKMRVSRIRKTLRNCNELQDYLNK